MVAFLGSFPLCDILVESVSQSTVLIFQQLKSPFGGKKQWNLIYL